MAWYGLMESTITEKFGHIVWKMTEKWLFEIFGIWYDLISYGMVLHGMSWYSLFVLSRSTTMQNFGLLAWEMTEFWLFEIFGIWYDLVWYNIIRSLGII